MGKVAHPKFLSKKSCFTVLHQLFYVSVLLLDDTSKTATPLTNGAINLPHSVTIACFTWLIVVNRHY